MPSLIDELNKDGELLPPEVKDDLMRRSAELKNVDCAVPILSVWCVESMPNIAAYHNVDQSQVIDSLQHYRFGVRQAENLTMALGGGELDRNLLGLFTIIHDIGRMMVGSGASRFSYPPLEGALLHSIVGASMLKQAFSPLRKSGVDEAVDELLKALEYTAERHTRSIGLTPQAATACNLSRLKSYAGCEWLLLAEAKGLSGKFARYAHLVALADLINNVSETLNGTLEYRPVHAVPGTAAERVEYVKNACDSGIFQIVRIENKETVIVRRCWREGECISGDDVQKKMMEAALRDVNDEEKKRAETAFLRGLSAAFA